MVNEIAAGRIPDAKPGLLGKQRSVHNNYATMPVIFIMLSNHFSFTYAHPFGWLVLVALFVNGMWLRHYFNLKHQGIKKPQVLVTGLLAFFAIMLAIAPWQAMTANPNQAGMAVTDEQALAIVNQHCTECHSTNPRSELFTAAPAGLILESLDQVRAAKVKVTQRAIINKDMPLGNLTQMTDLERQQLASWLAGF